MPAIKTHHTATTDEPWSKGPNVKRLPSPMSVKTAEAMYAWMEADSEEAGEVEKKSLKFPHHMVSADGVPGKANVDACHSIVSILNGSMGGSDIPSEDRQGVYDHARAHLEDAGEKDIADLKSIAAPIHKAAKTYSHLASRVFGRVHAIRPDKLDEIMAYLTPRLEGNLPIEAYGAGDPKEKKEYEVTAEGIAIIPICGTLVKSGGWMSALSGLTGYDNICACFSDACADPSIRGILLDVDSPGGEVSGLFDLVDLIYSARGDKPIWAFANDSAFSAAYAIASAADRVYVEKYTGGVGSIGVIALHCDESEYDKKQGFKYTAIYAGERKNDGSPHVPLSTAALQRLQAEVDRIYQIFVATVARNRSIAEQKVVNTQAGLYFADQSVPLLADKLASRQQVLAEMGAAIQGDQSAGILRKSAMVLTIDTTEAKAQIAELAEMAAAVHEKILQVSAAANDEATAAESPSVPEPGREANIEQQEKAEMAKVTLTQSAAASEVEETEELALAAKKADVSDDEQDEEDMPTTKKADAADGDPDEDDQDDDEDDEDKKEKNMKSSKKKAVVQGVSAADMKQIAMLCTLAGVPEKTAEFLADESTVAEVQKALLSMRSKKQAAGISSHAAVNANANTFANLARQAALDARKQNKTKEQAITEALLANPSAYDHFLEIEKPQFEAQCRANRDHSRAYQVVQS